MPPLDDSQVGRILAQYYRKSFGGPETWERIESFRLLGALHIESGEFLLTALQKKPALIKLSIVDERRQTALELGYDGETAWQKGPRQPAVPMGPDEARRFIHSAAFGTHLLYPFAEGKTIRYVDTVPIEGFICHHLRVEFGGEYQVDYFIDVRSHRERKVINTDLATGFVNTIHYKTHDVKAGIVFATEVDNYEEGEWVSTLVIDEIKINSGVMPWMFHMPDPDLP